MDKMTIKISLTLEQSIMLLTLGIFLLVGGCSRAQEYKGLDSKTMSQEIIRQLERKEGMTIEDFMIRDYFRRMMEK